MGKQQGKGNACVYSILNFQDIPNYLHGSLLYALTQMFVFIIGNNGINEINCWRSNQWMNGKYIEKWQENQHMVMLLVGEQASKARMCMVLQVKEVTSINVLIWKKSKRFRERSQEVEKNSKACAWKVKCTRTISEGVACLFHFINRLCEWICSMFWVLMKNDWWLVIALLVDELWMRKWSQVIMDKLKI